MIRTLTATAPDGTVVKRNTAADYTHVTLIYDEVKGVKSWGAVSWSSSEALASKQFDKWSKVSRIEKCVVVPVN
jgi:hypothetical protein